MDTIVEVEQTQSAAPLLPLLNDGSTFSSTFLVLFRSSLHVVGSSTTILLLDDILYVSAGENDLPAELVIVARSQNSTNASVRDRREIRLTCNKGSESNRDIWATLILSARIGCVEDSSGQCAEAQWLANVVAASILETSSASSDAGISSSSSSSSSSLSSPRKDISGILSIVFTDRNHKLSPPSIKKLNSLAPTSTSTSSTTSSTTTAVGSGSIIIKRKRRLLVYVFPASGKGQAESIWLNDVAPLFADAHIDTDVIVTKRACQAKDELRTMSWGALCVYSGVVAIGGDGALSEVVEGLLLRHDWKKATQRVTVGVIPAGSGNGMALSLLSAAHIHPASTQNAAMLIARGRCVPLDISSTFVRNHQQLPPTNDHQRDSSSSSSNNLTETAGVSKENPVVVVLGDGGGSGGGGGGGGGGEGQTPSTSVRSYSSVSTSSSSSSTSSFGQASPGLWGERRFSFLSLEWAIIADIDIESESLRFLGDARFDVYGAVRGLSLRKYSGRFSYLPADRAECSGRKARLWWGSDGKKKPGQLTKLDGGGGGGGGGGGEGPRSRTGSMWSDEDHESAITNAASGLNEEVEGGGGGEMSHSSSLLLSDSPPDLHHLLPFNIPAPLSWRSIEGVFTFLWITNTTHQSKGVAISPNAHYNNGTMTVTLVRDCNPLGMLRVLLAMDEKGSIAQVPGVETFTCSAWRLEPDKRKIGGCFKNRFVAPDGNHIALDGEVVEYGPIQAEVHAGLIRVFG